MTEPAGDNAATAKAGETAHRPAEEAADAPPMEGEFEAPDNIRDIDNALADVAEDLARLDHAAGESTRDERASRERSPVNDALGEVAQDLDDEPDGQAAQTLEDLDNELASMDPPDEAPADNGVEDAIGQIFAQQASAVRRKPATPPPAAKPAEPEPEDKPEPESAAAAEPAEASAADADVEIEIEEVDEVAGTFQAPTDIFPATARHAGAPADAPAEALATAPTLPVETDEPEQAPQDDVEIEIEEVEARSFSAPPEAPQAPAPAPAKAPAPPPAAKAAPAPVKADALAAAAEAAAAARDAAKAPTAKSSKLAALLGPLVALLVVVNKPFGKMPRATRDTIGLLGAGTLFNALCAWVYWLLIR